MTAEVTLTAPAKLTLTLRITGVRPDGYHLLESEMVAVDLVDTLHLGAGSGLTVVDDSGQAVPGVPTGSANLVARALAAVDRQVAVRLVKQIPPGAGLGGGSSDAAAVLRWAGCTDLAVAALLGADVPFCLTGGRAMVGGVGERVTRLDDRPQELILLLPPFGVDTPSVYRAWDRMAGDGSLPEPGTVANDLEAPAIAVEPRLAAWRRRLAEVTGAVPRLAGSGSTWFVEGSSASLGLDGVGSLDLDGEVARLVPVRTLSANPA